MNSPSAPPGQANRPPPVCVTNWFSMSNFAIFSNSLTKPVRGSRLVADEQQPGVVFHALPPGRPALGGEIHAVIVGIAAPQDFGAPPFAAALPAAHARFPE